MSGMSIPLAIHAGVKKLQSLSEDQSTELLSVLNDIEPEIQRSKFTRSVSNRVKQTPKKDVRDIVVSLVSFYRYRQTVEPSLETAVKDILTSEDLSFSEEEQDAFKGRLRDFLDGIESLKVTAKAVGLLYARERVLTDAKIITDLRPVFDDGDEIADKPMAAMIIQTLQLTYMQDTSGTKREIFLAIDASDMKNFREILDRAESKGKETAQLLKGRTRVLEMNDEDLG